MWYIPELYERRQPLLRTGAVPSARVGRKYLVTIEALEAYLEGSAGPEKPVKAPPRKWQIK